MYSHQFRIFTIGATDAEQQQMCDVWERFDDDTPEPYQGVILYSGRWDTYREDIAAVARQYPHVRFVVLRCGDGVPHDTEALYIQGDTVRGGEAIIQYPALPEGWTLPPEAEVKPQGVGMGVRLREVNERFGVS
jgi:hypothetical protein